mgnify:CR=1 FL=1
MVKTSPDGTITISLTLPWSEIQAAYQNHLKRHAQTIEIKGFRKGKAPLDTGEKTLGKSKLYQHAFSQVFFTTYAQTVQDNHLKPLIAPQVKALDSQEGKDWQIEATTAQAPQFNLGDYQQYLKGKKKLEVIFDTLLQHIQFSVSPVLIDEEKSRALAKLLDQVNHLGLTIDQYLSGLGKTTDQIQAEYALTATTNLKLEFILQAIAENLKITPSQAEIDQFIAKSPNTPKAYITAILTKRLTVDAFLKL